MSVGPPAIKQRPRCREPQVASIDDSLLMYDHTALSVMPPTVRWEVPPTLPPYLPTIIPHLPREASCALGQGPGT